jgi:hypothetical protein
MLMDLAKPKKIKIKIDRADVDLVFVDNLSLDQEWAKYHRAGLGRECFGPGLL